MEPILDDDDRIDDVLAAAKKRPGDVQKLKRYIHGQGDLVHGCMFPETDIDIMIAVVMRFLQDHIFQKILFGAAPDAVETITFVEASMQTNVEPKRGSYACLPIIRPKMALTSSSQTYSHCGHGAPKPSTPSSAHPTTKRPGTGGSAS